MSTPWRDHASWRCLHILRERCACSARLARGAVYSMGRWLVQRMSESVPAGRCIMDTVTGRDVRKNSVLHRFWHRGLGIGCSASCPRIRVPVLRCNTLAQSRSLTAQMTDHSHTARTARADGDRTQTTLLQLYSISKHAWREEGVRYTDYTLYSCTVISMAVGECAG